MGTDITFESLVVSIRDVHELLAAHARKAVNISLTLRNWIIGCYIREYEQNGSDRAEYGANLLETLSERLNNVGLKGMAARTLRLYRQFYLMYPHIWQSVSAKSPKGFLPDSIWQAVSSESLVSVSPGKPSSPEFAISPERLVGNLSFSHFAELIEIDDPLKRTFYEIECIRGNWSVRELKRQIGSLYYERTGLSNDKKKLAELVRSTAETAEPGLAIRDPYVFEFLGLRSKEVMSESALENQLLDKLQEFLLELGTGFCFEARQKRILIGESYHFIDLVLYHRILKCHVLVELKLSEFSHENIGQLNTYVSWYKQHVIAKGDSPPIGILLCTQKDHALVEYALAGMDNRLFVSRYQLELPKKEQIERFIQEQMEELGHDL
ncbi:MAG: PDDEXK nuclease domain-containing protein [Candidatus Thermoplasmatota archaeon]